jgi:hypothetical protein
MKKFILFGAYFFGIFLAINCGFYFLTDKIYWQGYFQDIDNTHQSYLMADSHGLPLKGLTEEYGVFNFATESDSYEDMYRKIKFAIHNNDVRNIVISVDDHTLSSYRESMNNLDRSIGYSDIDDYPDVYAMIKEKYIRHYVVLLNPKSRSMIRKYFESSVLDWLGQKHEHASFIWKALSDEDRQSRADGRVNQQFPDNKRSEQLTNSLIDIINLCIENQVTLIGIKLPLSQSYVTAIGSRGYKADSILQSKGLTVLDFSTLYSQSNEYFENQDHMNSKGGELFSKVLEEALQGELQ